MKKRDVLYDCTSFHVFLNWHNLITLHVIQEFDRCLKFIDPVAGLLKSGSGNALNLILRECKTEKDAISLKQRITRFVDKSYQCFFQSDWLFFFSNVLSSLVGKMMRFRAKAGAIHE